MTGIPSGHRWARRLAVFCAGVLVLMLTSWVLSDPLENLATDWTAFDKTADRALNGETIYRPYDADSEPLPYLYPPFAIYLTLPLALFGFYGSWAISALGNLAAFIGGMVLFARSVEREFDATTGLIVATATGSVVSSSLIGQYSGVYVLAFGLAAHLWAKDKRVLAGIALSLLWLKPNIAIAVPVVLVWSRSWRACKGFFVGTALLVLSSLPFGLSQWRGFVDNAQMMAELQQEDIVPFHKMVTILGGFIELSGAGSESVPAIAVFLLAALVLGISVLALWTPSALEENHVRAFGALAIFVVVANLRMYFYDATLVAFGMFALWASTQLRPDSQRDRTIPMLAAATWLVLWGGVFTVLNAFVGVFAGLGLLHTALTARKTGSQTAQNRPLVASISSGEGRNPERSEPAPTDLAA